MVYRTANALCFVSLLSFTLALPARGLCQAKPDANSAERGPEERTPGQTTDAQPDRAPDQLRTLSRDELDVIKVMNAQERAWNQGDLQGFAAGYKNSPDTLFIGQQVSHGYAQMLSDYIHNYPTREAMGSLSFSDLEPHVLDSRFVVVLGRYHLDRNKKAGGPATGLFSLVFEKTDKGWKIVVDHTT